LVRFNRAWRNLRAAEKSKFSAIYEGTTEFGFLDEFSSDYIGKDYGASWTEVTSMGVEGLFSFRDTRWREFARDPDHVKFIWALLNGFLKVKAL